MTNGPIEPSADTRKFAKMCHEMYVALTMEGFTAHEALVLIGKMITANTQGGDS